MNKYLKVKYAPGKARCNVFFNSEGLVQIEIGCINNKFTAFWGGEWQSTWIIDTTSQTMTGSVDVKTHYFESGNIQVNLHKDFPSQELGAEATAEGIAKAIDTHETAYQAILDEMHEGFKAGLF